VAGRIPAGARLPGIGRLDGEAAARAFADAGLDAEAVLAVVDAAMVQAVRAVTVERGVDPRGLALIAFGGAGPLHACALADALGMTSVVVPARAGVLSAVGLLGSPRQATLVRSWPWPLDHGGLSETRFQLAREAARQLVGALADAPARVLLNQVTHCATVTFADGTAVEVELAVDCRYAGQSHELTVANVAAFEDEHRRRNGYARPGTPVEVTVVRAAARLPPPMPTSRLPAPATARRGPVCGAAVVAEEDCTLWVPPGWTAEVGGGEAWILRRSRS
ncbi:MAG: hydantoinase/oxoprolinase family protein, partial [Acidimicrobiales bacterium]